MAQLLLTAPSEHVAVPDWIGALSPQTATEHELRELDSLPELTVVRLRSLRQARTHLEYFRCLASLFERSSQPARILLAFDRRAKIDDSDRLAELFRLFPHPSAIEVTQLDAALAVLEALAKNQAARALPAAGSSGSPDDPLATVQSVIGATKDLRAASGRLSATRVADVFGLSAATIAKLAGVTRQAVSKTDDSPGIQSALQPLERIARLRARVSQDDFVRWLNLPHDEIDGLTPLEAILEGHAPAIANWVENLLVGNPT